MELLTEREIYSMYQQEKVKILNEKWNKLPIDDRLIIIEMFKHLNPNIKIPINEARWYNTVMDWAGLIPGIGSAVDLVNGFSYWRQGDVLFAILSWIGSVPLLGDVISTPVKSLLKSGGKAAQMFKSAVVAKDAIKLGEAAKNLGGSALKLVKDAPSWGSKLLTVLEKSVGRFPWLGKGLVNTVREWVTLFSKAGMEAFSTMGRPAISKLMRNTKWYMGFLDWLGLSDFKGTPDELIKKVPNIEQKMMEFSKTPSSSLDNSLTSTEVIPPPPSPPSKETKIKDDPIGDLMGILM